VISESKDELVVDRLIHEPGRLAILTVLSSVASADFVFLQRVTGLTKGNLSSHLTKLEEAALVSIEKAFIRKKPNTKVKLTAVGRKRIARHWEQLERLKSLGESPPDE
jgi:DNA-binding MarR family transcriptional regulator